MNRDQLIEYISGKFGDKVEPLKSGPVEPIFLLKDNSFLPEFCRAIKDDLTLQIDYLCNLAAVDTGEKFEIIYNVASVEKNIRFDFKLTMPFEGAEIASIQDIWPAANWYEREIWELYGINVINHGNLTRFLLPDDWNQGNPMRKNWDAPDFIRMPEL
jgi:NADH:ubiquinone oxidoreductase subunit C